MTRDEIKSLFPDATDEAISKMLNMHHSEMESRKKDNTDMADKIAKLAEQAQMIEQLQKTVETLTAENTATKKSNNTANAVAMLVKAGMAEDLAKSIASTSVTDDEKASNAAVQAIATAFAAQEKARQAEASQQRLHDMPKPNGDGAGAPSSAAEYGKRLGEKVAERINSGTLDEFKH